MPEKKEIDDKSDALRARTREKRKKRKTSVARTLKLHQVAKADFWKQLAKSGLVVEACETAQISRDTAYKWRKRDPRFAAAWDKALVTGRATRADELEKEADRRGLEGTLEPVFYKGSVIGSIRRYSDDLLKFRLRAEIPDKYRETIRQEHSGPGGGPIDYRNMTIEEKKARRDELKQRLGIRGPGSRPGHGAGIPGTGASHPGA